MEGFQADAFQADAFQLLVVVITTTTLPTVRGWVLRRGGAPWRGVPAGVRVRVR